MLNGNVSVLVVEDEPLIRMALVDELMSEGFVVEEADSADRAIFLLERNPQIRLVVTDIEMPGTMDGLKLAAFVRDRWPPIKIIIASGRITPGPVDLPSGCDFISKPFGFQQIAETVRAALS
ncbi:response regulator [Agrobacterium sp. BA1120]|uniref:response regulator n=1 Tax=Agrobacterium sp. BA1120 TaxID=3228927 RepID=UPI00336AC18F